MITIYYVALLIDNDVLTNCEVDLAAEKKKSITLKWTLAWFYRFSVHFSLLKLNRKHNLLKGTFICEYDIIANAFHGG